MTDNVNFLIADNDANKLQCRLVDQNNVLWTCHKACKIDYMDCRFAICNICYASKSKEMENKQVRAGTNVRKRRRGGNNNRDDDTTRLVIIILMLWFHLWIKAFLLSNTSRQLTKNLTHCQLCAQIVILNW